MFQQPNGKEVSAKRKEDDETMLLFRDVGKTHTSGGASLHVLRSINLRVSRGSCCAIVGPSGSGKSTLLGLGAGLDRPTTGSIRLGGTELEALDEDALARLRNQSVGFVFQSFQLLPSLTALENVSVPLELQGASGARSAAEAGLAKVGLGDRLHHYPGQLSGGEQQRVALARAFVHGPRILFADEPTGNLDAETSEPLIRLLFEMNEHSGTALVLVTHDPELARRAGRVIRMRGGRIEEDGAAQ